MDAKVAAAPAAAPAPASSPAQASCLSSPGNSVTAGQHWVYLREGQRKCWFQTAALPQIKKHERHRPAKPIAAASSEKESARREPKKAEDARAEVLLVPQTEPSASRLEVAAAPSGQSVEQTSQLTGEEGRLQPDNTAELRKDAALVLTNALQENASNATLSAATLPVQSTAQAGDDKRGSPATWIAVVLMTLGFGSIAGSNRVIRDIFMFRHKSAQV